MTPDKFFFAALFLVALNVTASARDPLPAAPTPTPSASPARLLNISSRAAVGTGNRVAIAGFITQGDAKDIIVRALGPSLQINGTPIAGRLLDPTLELFSASASLASNDDWKQTQRAQIEATHLQPPADAESAIVRNLPAGAYTAIMSGKNQTTGIGLVEVYDLGSSATSQLTNLSTRGFVGTGDNVLIGGFIAGGGDAIRLLIRVLGPSLNNAGINDALQDPMLELYDANGQQAGMNDNWQDDQQFQIQQTNLAPPNPMEAALLTELAPGNYTVIARGRNSNSGTALLEFYTIGQLEPGTTASSR